MEEELWKQEMISIQKEAVLSFLWFISILNRQRFIRMTKAGRPLQKALKQTITGFKG